MTLLKKVGRNKPMTFKLKFGTTFCGMRKISPTRPTHLVFVVANEMGEKTNDNSKLVINIQKPTKQNKTNMGVQEENGMQLDMPMVSDGVVSWTKPTIELGTANIALEGWPTVTKRQ